MKWHTDTHSRRHKESQWMNWHTDTYSLTVQVYAVNALTHNTHTYLHQQSTLAVQVSSSPGICCTSHSSSELHRTNTTWRHCTHCHRSHARTVVPECFKDDNASQWKSGKFDSRSLRNPWTERHQNLHGWLRGGPLPLCKISSRYDYPPSPPNMRKCASSDSASFSGSSDSLQPRPLHRLSRSIRQMTQFRARMCFLGVLQTKFYTSTPFSNKTQFSSPIFDGT